MILMVFAAVVIIGGALIIVVVMLIEMIHVVLLPIGLRHLLRLAIFKTLSPLLLRVVVGLRATIAIVRVVSVRLHMATTSTVSIAISLVVRGLLFIHAAIVAHIIVGHV